MSVAELLSASQDAHKTALLLRQRRDPEHRTFLIRARDLRHEALFKDPDRLDPAWGLERANHEALMAFYAKHVPNEGLTVIE